MALLILAHHRRATPGELDGTGWASRPRALALFSLIVKTRRVAACLVILAVAVTAHAQQPGKPWRIGYLAQAASAVGADTLGEFKRGLSELGYVDGQHYLLLVRDAGGRPDRLQTLATELASAPVDVIVTGSTPPALAAMRATRAIPIAWPSRPTPSPTASFRACPVRAATSAGWRWRSTRSAGACGSCWRRSKPPHEPSTCSSPFTSLHPVRRSIASSTACGVSVPTG